MIIQYHSNFNKHFKKRVSHLSPLVQKYKERVSLFETDKTDPILKDHGLKGTKKGQRAFWIAGDVRVVYVPVSLDEVIFVDIGSHNQVY